MWNTCGSPVELEQSHVIHMCFSSHVIHMCFSSHVIHMWIICETHVIVPIPHVFHMWVFTCVFFIRELFGSLSTSCEIFTCVVFVEKFVNQTKAPFTRPNFLWQISCAMQMLSAWPCVLGIFDEIILANHVFKSWFVSFWENAFDT
jgi:hypothetical protein